MHRMLDTLEEQNTPAPVKAARRKEEEEAATLHVLKVPSWHNYRDKQRQFLRKRERERRQRELQVERMARASRIPVQMRRYTDTPEKGFEPEETNDARQLDEDVMLFVRRLTIDMARSLAPADIPQMRTSVLHRRTSSESLFGSNGKRDYRRFDSVRRGSSSASSSV